MISNPSLMAHESESEYDKLVSGLMAAHNPRNDFERLVVENLAIANWELRRVRAIDSEYRDTWAVAITGQRRSG